MAGKISMGARREVVSAVTERYRSAKRAEKGRILDVVECFSRRRFRHRACQSACKFDPSSASNFGSDSLLMQFGGCVAL